MREQPLPGSGSSSELGSHLIDQALWFFGMREAVTAEINKACVGKKLMIISMCVYTTHLHSRH